MGVYSFRFPDILPAASNGLIGQRLVLGVSYRGAFMSLFVTVSPHLFGYNIQRGSRVCLNITFTTLRQL